MLDKTIEKIDSILDEAYQNIQYLLEKEFSYVQFLILSDSSLCLYIKGKWDDTYGVNLKDKIKVGQPFPPQRKTLQDLNTKGKMINESKEDYFYCVNCDRILPKKEFETNVFSGFYCKTCAQTPSVKRLIEESQEEAFYD